MMNFKFFRVKNKTYTRSFKENVQITCNSKYMTIEHTVLWGKWIEIAKFCQGTLKDSPEGYWRLSVDWFKGTEDPSRPSLKALGTSGKMPQKIKLEDLNPRKYYYSTCFQKFSLTVFWWKIFEKTFTNGEKGEQLSQISCMSQQIRYCRSRAPVMNRTERNWEKSEV